MNDNPGSMVGDRARYHRSDGVPVCIFLSIASQNNTSVIIPHLDSIRLPSTIQIVSICFSRFRECFHVTFMTYAIFPIELVVTSSFLDKCCSPYQSPVSPRLVDPFTTKTNFVRREQIFGYIHNDYTIMYVGIP